ncbi:hypothetical protein Bca4012_080700 [Brassica carinata]
MRSISSGEMITQIYINFKVGSVATSLNPSSSAVLPYSLPSSSSSSTHWRFSSSDQSGFRIQTEERTLKA